MEIFLKNQFNKGKVLPIIVEDNKVTLISTVSGNKLDITSLVEASELPYLKRVGKAVAIVKDNETLMVSYCFNYHTHSQYSILDGMSPLKSIAKKSSGITAVTDHGNMFNILKWQYAMEHEGKKPVFGFEAYVEDVLTGEKNGTHGLFLVKDNVGLKNAFELTSRAYDNFYRKPHVSLEMIKQYHEGLIFTSACVAGELAKVIEVDYEGARQVALTYKSIFDDDYYIEIQNHRFEKEQAINTKLIKLAKELNIKVVAANDSHFISKEDELEHRMLLAINYNKSLAETEGFDGDGYWYKTDKEMVEDFINYPEAVANTIEMALKCDAFVETGVYHTPNYPIPEGFKDDNEYLLYLIDEGFKERFAGTDKLDNPIYLERLEYEKSVVKNMGYSSYFLIVWDYVNWAKNQGIMVGPGRGSGAGSLCLYCLKITDLDPIKYALKFERFLNPDRVSMPDIDMDFEDSRRAEVIEYVRNKYGEECVCNIITFGTMQAKNSVKDIARVKGKDVAFSTNICKKINEKAKNLKGSLEGPDASIELVSLANSDLEVKQILESAMKLEGNPRQTGIHACGIVVSDAAVRNYLPTAMVKDSKSDEKDAKCLASQVTMAEVEEMGLLKMDFLGLKTMSVIGKSLTTINRFRESQGLSKINSYLDIPLTDPYVYAEISEGNTQAIFQIESEGMRGFMKQLFADVKSKIKAIETKYGISGYDSSISNNDYMNEMTLFGEELFERIIAGVSLYRPGPMEYIPDYIDNMNNPDDIVYDTPQLEPILKSTYGVIVYQEQVMDLVRALAGFTAGQSDTIRKAMGKKKQAILDEYMPYFIEGSKDAVDSHSNTPLNIKGCVENGISKEIAERIWNKMADFAKYAFNKSHAAAYSVITIVCAWLKHYYPPIFMSATLNVYIDNNEKLAGYIAVTKDMGISIIPPSVNLSGEGFLTNGRDILFGLKGLKGLSKTVSPIIAERTNEKYKSVVDFVSRTFPLGVSRKSYESLVLAGCFDEFGFSRRALIDSSEELIGKAKDVTAKNKKADKDQLSFFDMLGVSETEISYEIENKPEYTKRELLNLEHEVASIYISAHPIDEYSERLLEIGISSISDVKDEEENINEGIYTFAGVISDVKEIITKKGDKMATFVLNDRTSNIKVTVFPKEYESAKLCLEPNGIVVVRGEVENNESFGLQLICSSIIDIDNIPSDNNKNIVVSIDGFGEAESNQLCRLVKAYSGDKELFVQDGKMLYKCASKVSVTSGLFMTLFSYYGNDKVKFS